MKQRRSSSDPYNQNKPWTLADRRLAYLTFTRKDVTELEKFQLARSLGRRATSVQVMVFSLMPALPGKEKKSPRSLTEHEIRYCRGEVDSPFPPRPVAVPGPEPEPEPEAKPLERQVQEAVAVLRVQMSEAFQDLMLEEAAARTKHLEVAQQALEALREHAVILREIRDSVRSGRSGRSGAPAVEVLPNGRIKLNQ